MDYLAPGGDIREDWRSINQLEAQRRALATDLAIAQDQINNLRVSSARGPIHPFKIYQLPWNLRTGTPAASDWRKVRVRAGRVLETDASGTDGASNPDAQLFPATGAAGCTEITVPADTAAFWFWLEIGSSAGSTTAIVRYHTNPIASSFDGGGVPAQAWTSSSPWTDYPHIDASHVPIGVVDSNSRKTDFLLLIRQFVRTDLVSSVASGEECPYG
jgi:hypothetical protein